MELIRKKSYPSYGKWIFLTPSWSIEVYNETMRQWCIILCYTTNSRLLLYVVSSIQHPTYSYKTQKLFFIFSLHKQCFFSTFKGICFFLVGLHHDHTWHYVTFHDITSTWRDNKVGPICSLWFIISGFGLH